MNIVTTDYSMQTRSYDIFFSGCLANPKCEGCHNAEAWDFSKGTDWKQHKEKIAKDLKDFGALIDRVFILGGDPLDQDLIELHEFLDFLEPFNIPSVLFTRYILDNVPLSIVSRVDYIKTGRYIPRLTVSDNTWYNIKLSTSNQRVWKRGVDY